MTETTADLVGRLTQWLSVLPPDQPRITTLIGELQTTFGERSGSVSAEVVTEIERLAWRHSRHLELSFVAEGGLSVDQESPGWDPDDVPSIRRRAANVSSVRRTEQGVAILALDGLPDLDLAEPYLDAAITLTAGATGILLDLRRNGGGDPATVAKIIGWLCGPGLHISDVIYRDRTQRWITPETTTLAKEIPVAIMIGPGTYSSGEALAYHLQSAGRGPLVGTRTPGAADHVTPIVLSPHVRSVLPYAYALDARTRTNWEGIGVLPDVPAGPEEAVPQALALLGTG